MNISIAAEYERLKLGLALYTGPIILLRNSLMPLSEADVAADINMIAENNLSCPYSIQLIDRFENRITLYPNTRIVRTKSIQSNALVPFVYFPQNYLQFEPLVEVVDDNVVNSLKLWPATHTVKLISYVWPEDGTSSESLTELMASRQNLLFEPMI